MTEKLQIRLGELSSTTLPDRGGIKQSARSPDRTPWFFRRSRVRYSHPSSSLTMSAMNQSADAPGAETAKRVQYVYRIHRARVGPCETSRSSSKNTRTVMSRTPSD